jgi:carbamate kinase
VRIVVALGGNALALRGEPMDELHQVARVRVASNALAGLAREHTLIVTHGNGPQVGQLAAQPDALPLDVLGAESEGMIGYWIERELINRLPGREIVTLLTQVEVDARDPAFRLPTKPIGPVLSERDGRVLARERGWQLVADGGGVRRVVASPEPRAIVERATIGRLVDQGVLVICGGGGGIPVVRDADAALAGCEAVIDKDLLAARLAADLEADLLLLLTDVAGVFARWPADGAPPLRHATPPELAGLDLEAGTMGPKVEAACRFASRPGAVAAIGALEQAGEIVRGDAGTRIAAGDPVGPA